MYRIQECWVGPASMVEAGLMNIVGSYDNITDALWYAQKSANMSGGAHEVIPDGEYHKRWYEPFCFYTVRPEGI